MIRFLNSSVFFIFWPNDFYLEVNYSLWKNLRLPSSAISNGNALVIWVRYARTLRPQLRYYAMTA